MITLTIHMLAALCCLNVSVLLHRVAAALTGQDCVGKIPLTTNKSKLVHCLYRLTIPYSTHSFVVSAAVHLFLFDNTNVTLVCYLITSLYN